MCIYIYIYIGLFVSLRRWLCDCLAKSDPHHMDVAFCRSEQGVGEDTIRAIATSSSTSSSIIIIIIIICCSSSSSTMTIVIILIIHGSNHYV